MKMTDHPLHQAWKGIKARCYNPNHKDYSRYGGRGIVLCEKWHDFWAFVSDVGERPEGFTLDRVDPDRGYEPGNVRWASRREQTYNRSDISEHSCPHGHEYDEENTGFRQNGDRYCRACGRIRVQSYRTNVRGGRP